MIGLKKLIALSVAAVMSAAWLGGCGPNSYSTQKQKTNGGEKVPIAQVYDGYAEAAKGCRHLILPDNITMQTLEEVYTFETVFSKPEDHAAESRALFRGFFGKSYAESGIDFNEKLLGYYYNNGKDQGTYRGSNFNMQKASVAGVQTERSSENAFLIGRDDGRMLDGIFPEAELTVSDIAGGIPEELFGVLGSIYPDFEIRPYSILGLTAGMENFALLHLGLEYKGLPVQSFPSSLFNRFIEGSERKLESYTFSYIEAEFDKNGELVFLGNGGPLKVVSSKKQDEIISLASAIELLDSELAENIEYEIDDVQLMYCCKTVYPEIYVEEIGDEKVLELNDELDKIPLERVPTWCFIGSYKNGWQFAWSLKVNAITGEITIDAPKGAEKQKGAGNNG